MNELYVLKNRLQLNCLAEITATTLVEADTSKRSDKFVCT